MKKYKNRLINIMAMMPCTILVLVIAIMSIRHASEELFLKVVPAFTIAWLLAQGFLFFEIVLVGVVLYKDIKEQQMKKRTIKWISADSDFSVEEERRQKEEQ